jgi:hypothetical protein
MDYEAVKYAIEHDDEVNRRLIQLVMIAKTSGKVGLDVLSAELHCSIPHCEKGLCLAPSTRLCNFYSGVDRHVVQCGTYGREPGDYGSGVEVCDRCGGPETRKLAWAETVRSACALLKARGVRVAWDEDRINDPADSP